MDILELIYDSYILLISNHFKDLIVERSLNGRRIKIEDIDIIKLIIVNASYIGDKNLE